MARYLIVPVQDQLSETVGHDACRTSESDGASAPFEEGLDDRVRLNVFHYTI